MKANPKPLNNLGTKDPTLHKQMAGAWDNLKAARILFSHSSRIKTPLRVFSRHEFRVQLHLTSPPSESYSARMNPTQAPFFVDNEVITLTKNGTWISDSCEITHEPTRKLFSKSIRRDDKGYFIAVGRETKRIVVEDTAFFVHRVDQSSQGVTLWLSDETQEPLHPETLHYRPGRLVCKLQSGELAKFLHAPYFDLLKNLEETSTEYFIQIDQKKIPLAKK